MERFEIPHFEAITGSTLLPPLEEAPQFVSATPTGDSISIAREPQVSTSRSGGL